MVLKVLKWLSQLIGYSFSNLNGHYLEGVYPDEVRYHGVYWQEFRGPNYSLKKTRMLIRPIE